MCTFALAAVVAPSGRAAVAQARARQLDAGKSEVQANGITIAFRSYGCADRETILLITGVGGQLPLRRTAGHASILDSSGERERFGGATDPFLRPGSLAKVLCW